MDMIEPNVLPLIWFVGFASITSLGFYVLSGAFPLSTRPEFCKPVGLSLLIINCLFLLCLLAGALHFGITQLRWTSVVIVCGLAFLFAPGLFNIWPSKWRDGKAGLLIMMIGLGIALVLLGLASGRLLSF